MDFDPHPNHLSVLHFITIPCPAASSKSTTPAGANLAPSSITARSSPLSKFALLHLHTTLPPCGREGRARARARMVRSAVHRKRRPASSSLPERLARVVWPAMPGQCPFASGDGSGGEEGEGRSRGSQEKDGGGCRRGGGGR